MRGKDLSSLFFWRRAGYRGGMSRCSKPLLHCVLPGFIALGSWAMVYSASASEPQADSAGEHQVEALFLYNFAKFVDWPASSFSTPHDPLNICVIGEDPFGSELDEVVRNKSINGRQFVIRRISRTSDARSCHIAFIGTMDERRARRSLVELNSTSILTVGVIDGFTTWGGIIKFTLDENKVRFEINIEAAQRAQLRISSKLLSLAKVVVKARKR